MIGETLVILAVLLFWFNVAIWPALFVSKWYQTGRFPGNVASEEKGNWKAQPWIVKGRVIR